jgi:hypothetical protein
MDDGAAESTLDRAMEGARGATVNRGFYRQYGKRWLGFSISLPVLIVLSPFLLGIAESIFDPEEAYAREILLKKMRFYYRLVRNMSFTLDYGSSSKPLGHPAKPAQLLILWSIPC